MKRSQIFGLGCWVITCSLFFAYPVRADEEKGIANYQSADALLAQTSTPVEVVKVTGVQLNPTEVGIEVILATPNSQAIQPLTFTLGRTYIANIPSAVLSLPQGQAFRQNNPADGIASVTVTQATQNSVRITVVGEAAVPTVELYDSPNEGLILSLSPAISPQQPPTPPEKPAAEADESLEEIVVTGERDGYRVPDSTTATKTDTPIRDIPQSIQVIPRQVLEDRRVTRVREAVRNVSGVTPGGQGSESTVGETYIFRGFAETTNPGSTFVNGFRRFNILGRQVDVANIEQIEILKGPASVLYGQGEPGGILNVTTKQPLSEPFYAVEGTIGNFDFYRPTFDISSPLNADKTIRYRLNGAYQNSGSYVDFVETEQVFLAPVVSFELGKNTTLTLEAEYLNTSKVEYLGIPAVGSVLPSGFGRVPRARFVDDPDLKLERNFVGLNYRLQHKFSDNWSIRNGFRAEFENYDEPFSFILGLQADNRTVNRNARFDDAKSRNYFLQTDVLGTIQTGTVKQDLLFGLELGQTNYIRETFSPTPALPPIDLFNPNYERPSIEFENKTADTENSQNSIGVYAQDLISIGDKLKILLGGRFDFVDASFENEVLAVSRDREDTAFSPRVGVVYQPIEPVSLYASWTRSFQTSNIALANADNTPFEPTKGEQFEVGVKTEFLDGRLAATLAAYEITKQNIVVADPANPGFSLQVGEQRSRGIELDVAGEILPGWKIIASYAYIDAEITEDIRPAFQGNEPNNVPRTSASLWTTYEIQKGNLQGLGFGAGIYIVGDRQGDLENTFELPSYAQTDAAIYYRRDNWQAALNFKNLFDAYYFESASSRNSVYPGAPFTVLGTVSVQF